MASEFRMVRLVEFADTDMAGIVHFANFFRYMEETEHAFLRSLGLSVQIRVPGAGGDGPERLVGLPRVHADCTFTRPLCYQDQVEIRLSVREKKARSITYDFVFLKLEAEAAGTGPPGAEAEVARGCLTVVSVAVDPETGAMKAVPLPEALERQVEPAGGRT